MIDQQLAEALATADIGRDPMLRFLLEFVHQSMSRPMAVAGGSPSSTFRRRACALLGYRAFLLLNEDAGPVGIGAGDMRPACREPCVLCGDRAPGDWQDEKLTLQKLAPDQKRASIAGVH